MENFSINISVIDCFKTKCQTNSMSTTKIITSLQEYIPLYFDYYLKIISVNSNYVLISIDNGVIFYVRKAYINIPITLCISSGSNSHQVTIQLNSITL